MAEKTAEQWPAQAAHEVAPVDLAASQLSALVDEELADAEMSLVLRRLSRDNDTQQRWERYHLISNVLQGHLPTALDTDFAVRLHQAIDDEPLPQPATRTAPIWYKKPVTGFAIAASVVLTAVFGLQLTQSDSALTPSNPVATVPTTAITDPTSVVALNPFANETSEPTEARLNSYLVSHNGYASRNSVNGMLPYVRMVGYQTHR